MWGADIWNLYGTEGLVKRTPTVTRQQRRRARQQVDMVSDHKVALPHVEFGPNEYREGAPHFKIFSHDSYAIFL